MPASVSDQKIEDTLKQTVLKLYNNGQLEELTLKRVRTLAESALGLSAGHLKADSKWNSRSKRIISSEVVSLRARVCTTTIGGCTSLLFSTLFFALFR